MQGMWVEPTYIEQTPHNVCTCDEHEFIAYIVKINLRDSFHYIYTTMQDI